MNSVLLISFYFSGRYHFKRLTEAGKCDIKNRTGIQVRKDAFQMLSNVLRNGNISRETKKRDMDSDVISIILYSRERWAIHPKDEDRTRGSRNLIYRRIMKIPRTELLSHKDDFNKMATE